MVTACSGSSAGGSEPGPLVDNTKWVPTEEGEALIGVRPPDAVCDLMPLDCDGLYPWPEGECVVLGGSPCVTAYVPECLDSFTVLAVYTRMPNPAEPLCNWLTLAQPSLRDIRAGDEVEIRMRHATLTAPSNATARMMFVIGDVVALDYEVSIEPSPGTPPFFPTTKWTAPHDYPQGTQLLFHIDNHGSNEYMLIDVNLLDVDETK